jgi:phage-related protein
MTMSWTIAYHTSKVEKFALGLPDDLLANYLRLSDMMVQFGANLGMPHTRALGSGLFELRVSGNEGIARVFFCTRMGQRIVMLHGFIKKTQQTPPVELQRAYKSLAEAKLK